MTDMPPFTAPWWLRNAHGMTILPKFWPRTRVDPFRPVERRLFTVAPGTQILGYCHWQSDRVAAPTMVLLHGLEGSSESHYMLGLTDKGWAAGLNIVRLNQRTCGGSEALSPTLYNSGLSHDFRAALEELSKQDGLDQLWFVGYSMGGNLALKMAGEAGSALPSLCGLIAVSPNIDPTVCVQALEQPANRLYHEYFVRGLKARLARKAALSPGRWDISALAGIRTIRAFDDLYTAPDGGYEGVADYYDRSGARHVLDGIHVPTTIFSAMDDPFIPISMFEAASIRRNPWIRLCLTNHGGHCGFLQRDRVGEDRFWVENRIVELIVNGSATR
ncbi:alpha/beta fold hydrolase [Nitrospirales bacterium NOB]|nr:MAG: putative alpha/beta fold family hydrolase [Nitrospira sp. OLB3]MBV6471610.1 2-succinyl-6-hydroxy-2,4-cyclohexadiene-1-carboxylate synthase [Nitrospirota bacterium]MCE7966660.1 alpha/beta fold hydrolase [Nitrospira sp. NTP2]MCK6493851.1 alpha/beta fold hydrolase [Nitrospira sp.]MDL1888345.1 alpha/beta fold hydrolase [Nitrospirales bacterium NOB]MEB2338706.1 alpha/beta fold hydrolase [Nitrospirales bacterium]